MTYDELTKQVAEEARDAVMTARHAYRQSVARFFENAFSNDNIEDACKRGSKAIVVVEPGEYFRPGNAYNATLLRGAAAELWHDLAPLDPTFDIDLDESRPDARIASITLDWSKMSEVPSILKRLHLYDLAERVSTAVSECNVRLHSQATEILEAVKTKAKSQEIGPGRVVVMTLVDGETIFLPPAKVRDSLFEGRLAAYLGTLGALLYRVLDPWNPEVVPSSKDNEYELAVCFDRTQR